MNLLKSIQILWMQHSEWTRMAFASMIFENPDEEAVTKRLLRNPNDFYYLLINFYDENVALKFRNLLLEHLILAAELVKASMVGDTRKSNDINSRLYKNADEISYLLASINPFWNYDEWRNMLYMHLDLAKKMAQEMITGKYEDSLKTYDEFEAEILVMSSMMTNGLIKQVNSRV